MAAPHSTKGDFACKSIKKPPIWPLAAAGVSWEINDFSRSLQRGEIYIFNAAAVLWADEWLNASRSLASHAMLLDQKGRRLINGCTPATLSLFFV